ncbi:hypothetical protein FRC18_010085 [Serendipita sp. 400]|nr:hypothetical protein FRC18_010085 [Serendipita sp. 400]
MQSLTTSITPLQGFHFTFQDNIPEQKKVEQSAGCNVYVLHRFPKDVFVDPYELEQRVLDGVAPTFKIWGETDLELPVSSVKEGSSVLLGPLSAGVLEFPFHARYPIPLSNDTHATIDIQQPTLISVCKNTQSRDTDHQVLHALFSPYEVPFDVKESQISTRPFTHDSPLTIRVPAGNPNHIQFVEPITLLAVFVSVYYIGRAMWKSFRRPQQAHIKQE